MSCNTCGHTIQFIGGSSPPTYWCPRCGSLTTISGGMHTERSLLVDRCRDLRKHAGATILHQLGITEATLTPPQREKHRYAMKGEPAAPWPPVYSEGREFGPCEICGLPMNDPVHT